MIRSSPGEQQHAQLSIESRRCEQWHTSVNFVPYGRRREVWPGSRGAITEGASPILALLCLAAPMPLATVALWLDEVILSPIFAIEHS